MAVIILEDQQIETSESFSIVIEELGVMTEVIILDDDGKNQLATRQSEATLIT